MPTEKLSSSGIPNVFESFRIRIQLNHPPQSSRHGATFFRASRRFGNEPAIGPDRRWNFFSISRRVHSSSNTSLKTSLLETSRYKQLVCIIIPLFTELCSTFTLLVCVFSCFAHFCMSSGKTFRTLSISQCVSLVDKLLKMSTPIDVPHRCGDP